MTAMPEQDFAPRQRTFTMLEWARRAWGKEWTKPDPGYEFTGRKFDTPSDGGEIYNGGGDEQS